MPSRRHRRESNDPRSDDPRRSGPRPSGPRPMEPQQSDPKNMDLPSNDPQPTEYGLQPEVSDTDDQYQQQQIKNLSERLADIRRELERLFLIKEERVKSVKRQNDRINRMERERRPKEEIKKEKKELQHRVDDLEGLLKVLAQTRDGEEEVFLKKWHLQHDK